MFNARASVRFRVRVMFRFWAGSRLGLVLVLGLG